MYRDGEVPQMTTSPQSTSPRICEDLAPSTGPQYRSLLYLSHKNRTSSLLQILNFRGLVWTAGPPHPCQRLHFVDFELVVACLILLGKLLVWQNKNAM